MITRLYCTIIKLAVHKEKQWLGDLVSLQAYTVSRGWWGGGGQVVDRTLGSTHRSLLHIPIIAGPGATFYPPPPIPRQC